MKRAQDFINHKDYKSAINSVKKVLAINIKFAPAHYLIGYISLQNLHLKTAVKALEYAVQLDSRQPLFAVQLASAYLTIGDYSKAKNTVIIASKLNYSDITVIELMASMLGQVGLQEMAVAEYQRGMKISKNIFPLYTGIAQCYIELGKINNAKVAIKNALAIKPSDFKSWWTLSQLEKATDSINADNLIAMSENDSIEPMSMAYLGFAAGKFYEDIGEWQKAFSAYEIGNKNKRITINYKPDSAKSMFRQLKETCTKEWLIENNVGQDTAEPIFIIGQPRTGTTLIDRILSNHKEIQSLGETMQMPLALRALTKSIKTSEFISADLIKEAGKLSPLAISELYMESISSLRDSKNYFIDKLPMNFLLVGFIAKAFPNAKIIHVKRNAADCCFSNYKQLFSEMYPHSYDQHELVEHYIQYRNLMEYWQILLSDRIYDISYENVVNDIQSEAQKLISHIGLKWDDNCTNFHLNPTSVSTASAVQVREKAHNRSVGRWKNFKQHLNPIIQALIKADLLDNK